MQPAHQQQPNPRQSNIYGSLAVNLTRFQTPQRFEPPTPEESDIIEQRPSFIKVRTPMPWTTMLCLALIVGLLLGVVYTFNRNFTVNAETLRLEREYQQLRLDEQYLIHNSRNDLTLREIDERARTLFNMAPPGRHQIVHVDLSGSDHAFVYQPLTGFARFREQFLGLFRAL